MDVVVWGLDIDDVFMVFNYDIVCEIEVYVYCIGCIGWVGSIGLVCILFSEKEVYWVECLVYFLD